MNKPLQHWFTASALGLGVIGIILLINGRWGYGAFFLAAAVAVLSYALIQEG